MGKPTGETVRCPQCGKRVHVVVVRTRWGGTYRKIDRHVAGKGNREMCSGSGGPA